ncbi:MAG TPA: TolC family protein [Prolixibacteraceae bacterium]|nr:TolC family protein [Prolixibacteraceae bacterium]
MKRNPTLALTLLLSLTNICVFSQEQTAKPLTFTDAYEQMHQNSHVLKQAAFGIREKEADKKAAFGLRAPRVFITANAIQMADPLTLDLTPVQDAITPLYQALGNYGNFSGVPNPDPNTSAAMPTLSEDVSTQVMRAKLQEGLVTVNEGEWDKMIQEKQFATVNANFIWPLYTGGKINAANKASQIYEEEAGLQKKQKEGELLSELANRYYGLVLAQQACIVREQVSEAMKKHLYDSKKLSEQGQIAKVEYLHAQVANSDADRELKKANRETVIVKRALQNTMAIDDSSNISPASKLFILKSIEDENYFIRLALENNPMLQQVDSKRELAATGVMLEKSNYLPSVALTGTYDMANKDLSPYVPDWMVGVGLKWSLFEGNSRQRKLQAAKFKEDQVEQAGLKAEEDIKTVITKLHQELGMQVEQLEGLDQTLEFAKTYVDSRNKAFIEGLSTSTELVDANLLLAKVKIDRLQAMFSYDVTLATLLQVCGSPDLFLTYQSDSRIITETF